MRAWENKLGAEMRADYFADLAGTFHFRQRLATWLTLFCSSGAVFTALAKLPPDIGWLAILMPLAAAATSFYSVVAQNQKSAVEASDLHPQERRGWPPIPKPLPPPPPPPPIPPEPKK